METTKHENILPVFPGFYNTIFENFPLEFDGEGCDENWEYSDDAVYPSDMQPVGLHIFEAFKKEFKKELEALKVNIEFEKLVSPKYYNYTNDQIYIIVHWDISEEDFDKAFENDGYRERLYYALQN